MHTESMKTWTHGIGISLLLAFSQLAGATNNVFDVYSLKSGVHACGGNYRAANDGTVYGIRNFNNSETINN